MAQILDDVSYLSQEIGPRPAGTEEEQQAALYIADKLKKEAGFDAAVEDFKCVPDHSILTIGFFGLAFVAALVAFLVNVAAIPAVIVGLAVAVLYGLELADRPVVSRFLKNGISQNVVAKYEPHVPGDASSKRRRKIILVARYDSGRSMPLMRSPFVNVLPVLKKGSRISMAAVPVLLLIRHLAFAHSAGVGALLFNILIIVGMVFILVALAWNVFYRLQQYNDAANSNASGVAVMLEVARRIGAGTRISDSIAEDENAVVHGEDAARKEGLIPEGAEISYTADAVACAPEKVEETPQKEAERLAAAKAAIAALTGASTGTAVPVSDISDNLVKVEPEPVQETEELRHEQNMEILNAFAGGIQASEKKSDQESMQEGEASSIDTEVNQPEPQVEAKVEIPVQTAVMVSQPVVQNTNISSNNDTNVPDWYKKAQQRAKRQPQTEPEASFRSRYAAALDATEEKLHEQDMQQEERARQEAARQEEERQKRLIQEQMANLARQRAQEASKQNEVVVESAPTETAEPSLKDNVSRETEEPIENQTKGASDYASMDVSRETSENQIEARRVVSRETTASVTEAADAARPQHDDGRTASSADSTMMMSPIDVSDLLAEMKDYKTAEPEVPAFITGEHEKVRVPTSFESNAIPEIEPVQETDSTKGSEPDNDETSRLIDPNAPFVPVPTDRTLKMSVKELSGESVENMHDRAHIVLPDLPKPEVAPISEVTKQRAPLADVTDNKAKEAARSLLSTVLPEVGTPEKAKAAKREAAMAHLSELPSLSGELRTIQTVEEASTSHEHNTVSATGSFATVGATGSFTAVGDELVADVAPEELYIEDADDSDYEENFTETGAFAGPGYVEMPKSRMQKLLGKFGFGRKKKHEEEVSTHEWLQVDEDFEARSVGKQRGSWESFQHEDAQDGYAGSYEQNHTGDTGSFEMSDDVYGDGYVDGYADGSDYYASDVYGDGNDSEGTVSLPANSPMRRANTFKNVQIENDYGTFDDNTKRWNGGAVSSDRVEGDVMVNDKKPDNIHEDGISEEIEQIYQFRNPDIDMDVWFVALGASVSSDEGMRELISLHEPELKRAIVINLESLGEGELMFVNKEGCLKKRTATSRMKRCIKKATQETGVSCGTREIGWRESPATVAMEHKLQGMTLAGMDGAKPAGFADADDRVEKVREDRLQASARFVLSMLKNI